ncbi:DUF1176 domain-containing protein [Commensalibacter nepenthis]|uniref:DUF1176 domain-containing protein n=1 Tax=Commensalibacter nepenthis TaxID=3043872 RepID=A0ABT6Q662_9PROT|nr:DUF1176 domain-containing protein [Commensalibacter sp. TBRC 10068]MDI2112384.1 DUF1176 domain-containing protein [Commensalibacter sp. TBRC 10068]
MQHIRLMGLIGLGIGFGSFAYADGITYPIFEYKDWQIVCDNTRTCRAAGYSVEDALNRVSVLLTRKAGMGQEVTAKVKFSDISYDGDAINEPDIITLNIDNHSYGAIGKVVDEKISVHSLNKFQTEALIKALKGTSKITFVGGNKEWVLSGNGAAATLLKMDDVQGRVGTSSALIKKGIKSEEDVLPALPMPIIHQQPIPTENPKLWQSKLDWDAVKKELPSGKKLGDDNYCQLLTEGDTDLGKFEPQVVAVLSHKRLLVSGLCWRAAYNEGYGYWIIQQQQPYKPQLITTLGDMTLKNGFKKSNIIESYMKGRGLGDCISRISWVWDGENFVKTYDGNSGMCRMITLGGTWDLPSYVAKLK